MQRYRLAALVVGKTDMRHAYGHDQMDFVPLVQTKPKTPVFAPSARLENDMTDKLHGAAWQKPLASEEIYRNSIERWLHRSPGSFESNVTLVLIIGMIALCYIGWLARGTF